LALTIRALTPQIDGLEGDLADVAGGADAHESIARQNGEADAGRLANQAAFGPPRFWSKG